MRRILTLVLLTGGACGEDSDSNTDPLATAGGGLTSSSSTEHSAEASTGGSDGSSTSGEGSSSGDDSSTGGLIGDFDRGEALFSDTCGRTGCHGSDGQVGPAPGLVYSVPRFDDKQLRRIITGGIGAVGTSSGMPGQDFDEQQLADMLAYLRPTFPG